jgi:anaerobic nitric oxide reductase transcription regulator
VRELEHLIARSALRALSARAERPRVLSLDAADLGLDDRAARSAAATAGAPDTAASARGIVLRDAVAALERRLITESLARHTGNWAAAARELGMDRANLNRSARRLGLKNAA